MRKVTLRMNEQYKYDVIKKLVDTNGNKKNASIKLNCSIRTIKRLILKYKEEGKSGFIHKNRDRKPSSTFPEDIKNTVIDLYRTKYFNANLLHFSQLLNTHENISVSDTTINHWLRKEISYLPKLEENLRMFYVLSLKKEIVKQNLIKKTFQSNINLNFSIEVTFIPIDLVVPTLVN